MSNEFFWLIMRFCGAMAVISFVGTFIALEIMVLAVSIQNVKSKKKCEEIANDLEYT